MHEVLERAHACNDWRVVIASINAIKYAADGISDLCKQNEVEFYCKNLCEFIENENPRVRYDALDCIAIISDDFKPRIQKYHK